MSHRIGGRGGRGEETWITVERLQHGIGTGASASVGAESQWLSMVAGILLPRATVLIWLASPGAGPSSVRALDRQPHTQLVKRQNPLRPRVISEPGVSGQLARQHCQDFASPHA